MIKNRMKEYRAKYDMKQEDLAKLVGVRRETIGNLEKGRYNPSLVLAWNIAKVFHVSIEDVFTVEEVLAWNIAKVFHVSIEDVFTVEEDGQAE